jgi:hypothetical protein
VRERGGERERERERERESAREERNEAAYGGQKNRKALNLQRCRGRRMNVVDGVKE